MAADSSEQLSSVAALGDAVRRRLYDHVVAQPDAVSRDQAAAAAGIKRPLAAFHLDKLVEQGLLEVEFRRLTGRSGPGAGRPSKLYRRSRREFDVSLPPREYDLVGHVLAAGIQRATETGGDVVDAVRRVAFERGVELAPNESPDPTSALIAVLRKHGYEPRLEDGGVVLANCPFHALSKEHTDLVCGMNLALCRGLAEAVDLTRAGLAPQLQPQEGRCCVTFAPNAG